MSVSQFSVHLEDINISPSECPRIVRGRSSGIHVYTNCLLQKMNKINSISILRTDYFQNKKINVVSAKRGGKNYTCFDYSSLTHMLWKLGIDFHNRNTGVDKTFPHNIDESPDFISHHSLNDFYETVPLITLWCYCWRSPRHGLIQEAPSDHVFDDYVESYMYDQSNSVLTLPKEIDGCRFSATKWPSDTLRNW